MCVCVRYMHVRIESCVQRAFRVRKCYGTVDCISSRCLTFANVHVNGFMVSHDGRGNFRLERVKFMVDKIMSVIFFWLCVVFLSGIIIRKFDDVPTVVVLILMILLMPIIPVKIMLMSFPSPDLQFKIQFECTNPIRTETHLQRESPTTL